MGCLEGKKGYQRIGEDEEDPIIIESQDKAPIRDLIGFFICGLINNFGYVVMLSAALDLLSSAKLTASVVLLADSFPGFVVQLLAPFFIHYFPYRFRVVFVVLLACTSFLVTAFFEAVWIRLLGVVCAAISSGLGEITFLAYSSFYHKNTVSTFSSGTGGAGILGSVSYLGLRLLFDSKMTLIISSPIPLGMAIGFFFVLSKPDLSKREEINQEQEETATLIDAEPDLTVSQRLGLLVRLLPYTIPLFIVYFGEYLINQGISPILTFPDSWIHDRKNPDNNREYTIYQALYQIGVFISRSSVNFVPIRNLWMPAIFQAINAILLSFVAVFNFIPSIYIIFAIILWEGLLGGSIYVNTFYQITQNFKGKEKEFCLGATSMSYGLSITLSALAGIGWEPTLKDWRTRWHNKHH